MGCLEFIENDRLMRVFIDWIHRARLCFVIGSWK